MPHMGWLASRPRLPRGVGRADLQMERFVLPGDFLDREVLDDPRPPCQP
jgi:hypothetical protein